MPFFQPSTPSTAPGFLGLQSSDFAVIGAGVLRLCGFWVATRDTEGIFAPGAHVLDLRPLRTKFSTVLISGTVNLSYAASANTHLAWLKILSFPRAWGTTLWVGGAASYPFSFPAFNLTDQQIEEQGNICEIQNLSGADALTYNGTGLTNLYLSFQFIP